MRKSYRPSVVGLALAAMLFAFTLQTSASAQATAGTSNQFVPFTQLAVVPCANGGAGEVVFVSGILHIETHVTINDNRLDFKQQFQPQGATALGLITGDVYRAVGGTKFHQNVPFPNGAAEFDFVNNFRMIGPGPNNNLEVHQNIHVTINANGDVTSTVNNSSIDCN